MTSSRDRFLNALRGNPDGTFAQRLLYYVSRVAAGSIAGFMVVAMATSSREGHQSFNLGIYLGAIAAGAALALLIVVIPRFLRPKDWPTPDEFRRGAEPPRNDGERK
ncbi:MAG: hypothetical protein ACREIP_01950 [Alphaproteobacteria bacterium]